MISLRDVVTGFGVRDPLAEVWRRSLRGGGGGAAEITGVPPLRYIGDGRPLTDYRIAGNTVQDGTPSADAPVDVAGCGVRTGNLFDINATPTKHSQSTTVAVDGQTLTITGAWYIYYEIDVAPNTDYYVKWTIDYASVEGRGTIAVLTTSGKAIKSQGTQPFQFNSGENQRIRLYIYSGSGTTGTVIISNLMLNLGSTALPYEPYGFKLPMTVNGVEYPIFLGTVPTTRRVKKLVLTGEETIAAYDPAYSRFSIIIQNSLVVGVRLSPAFCSHYLVISDGRSITNVPNNSIYSDSGNGRWFIKTTDFTTVADFKSYLAAQYQNGTPVTVWYVLAEPETAVVNEPLMKIGDYADTVSAAQAGVTIPTVSGENVLDVPTEVKPSEITIKGGISSV